MSLHIHRLNHAVDGRCESIHIQLILRTVDSHFGACRAYLGAVHLCRRGIHSQRRRSLACLLHRRGINVKLCLRQVFYHFRLSQRLISIGTRFFQLRFPVVDLLDSVLDLLVGGIHLGSRALSRL